MSEDLRKNPRFVSTSGITARILIGQRALSGTLCDFSATGFSAILDEAFEGGGGTPIEVAFVDDTGKKQLKLSALVNNQRTQEGAKTRLGCQITDFHDQSDAYLAFLTSVMYTQGFWKSMAKKPS
ncbi:MAG: hypothetical protein BWY57_02739 [Betaproteobacteria bacterium ADurb.Bin341]|nr:MAG: hypothetical protein BWY57_02739 [Betaproteobacteria bacterium ADurb.Bin341]